MQVPTLEVKSTQIATERRTKIKTQKPVTHVIINKNYNVFTSRSDENDIKSKYAEFQNYVIPRNAISKNCQLRHRNKTAFKGPFTTANSVF